MIEEDPHPVSRPSSQVCQGVGVYMDGYEEIVVCRSMPADGEYELTYMPMRGRAEVIRILLAAANVVYRERPVHVEHLEACG